MVSHDRNNSIAADDGVLELEAMRKEDSSWHPCQVSISSSGVSLIVDYENIDSEDIVVNEDEAIARLRIRSIPLYGDDCVHIQEGERVLATQKLQSQSLFFDAEVEKALRVRHSKKVHCRCTFTIKWLHQDLRGGTLTVPSSSIMKLSTKSINEHPTICAFLSSLKSLSCSSTSPLLSVEEDMDFEMDLHELLEKQIEVIGNLADVSSKRISDNILLGVEVEDKGQIQCRTVAGSTVSKLHVQVPPDQNHLKRTTRRTNKLKMEMESKDPPPPSIQEKLSESKSPLNPLAARAALASLMSTMPRNLEVSICHEEKLDYTYSSDNNACKHSVMQPPNGTKSYNADRLSLKTAATSILFYPDTNKDVKSPISTRSALEKPQYRDDALHGISTKEKESKDKISEIPVSRASFPCSVAKSKLSQLPKVNKLTRSATAKGAGIAEDTAERKTFVEQKKLNSSTNPRRFTRSAVCKETQSMEDKYGVEEYTSGKYVDSDTTDQRTAVLESYALKDEKWSTSHPGSAVEFHPSKERNSLGKEKEGNKKPEVERKTSTGLRNSTSVSRLTRSAVHKEKGQITTKVSLGLEQDKIAQITKSQSSEGNATTCNSNVLKAKECTSSSLDADGVLSPVEERKNREKMSSAVKNTQKTEGNGKSSGSQKRKCTSSTTQDLRFSPRLRFLPRTRSQNKP